MENNNKKKVKVSFTHFLERFPEIELPITLSDREHHSFSADNDPLPMPAIEKYLLPVEQMDEVDEFTEFIPCFSLPGTEEFGFKAVIYWKAQLMKYEYILATFSKKGKLIDRKVIAGISSRKNEVRQSVVTIDEDWMIYIVEGVKDEESSFKADSSKAYQMELLSDGRMVFP
jgi:hypothetical protein